jgi:3-phosphoshikimate 1-carboxyvinyltransferase
MSAAIMSAVAQGVTTINGADCVAKSYPAFFEHYALLGGIVEKI